MNQEIIDIIKTESAKIQILLTVIWICAYISFRSTIKEYFKK